MSDIEREPRPHLPLGSPHRALYRPQHALGAPLGLLLRSLGTSPSWAPDGRQLYYVSPEQKLMAVDIKLAPAFAAGVPKPLFAMPAPGPISTYEYQVARDGRFLIATPVEERGAGPFTVVLDWPAALKKK